MTGPFMEEGSPPFMTLIHLAPANPGWLNAIGIGIPSVRHSLMLLREPALRKLP